MDVVAELSRPLEFRAWHLPSQRMYYGVFFDLDHVYLSSDDSPANKPIKREDCVLMQFTGTYDQVKVKIWEGDMMRWDLDWHDDINDHPVQYSSYYLVDFYISSFGMRHVDDVGKDYEECDDPDLLNLTNDEIVVGNRYEHQHLMELKGEQPLVIKQLSHETANA